MGDKVQRRRLVVATAGFVAVVFAGALTASRPPAQAQAGQTPSAQSVPPDSGRPAFEAVSVKANHSGDPRQTNLMIPLGRFVATNVTARFLIGFAYNGNQAGIVLRDDQISGGPSWLSSERHDIDAKVGDSLAEEAQKHPVDEWASQVRLMVRSLPYPPSRRPAPQEPLTLKPQGRDRRRGL
jgi:hypothetical protein